MSKICNKCKQDKNLNDFYKKKQTRDGLTSQCKICINQRYSVYQKKNMQKILSKNTIWNKNNKDKVLKSKRKWTSLNKDKIKKISTIYYKNNKERILSVSSKYFSLNKEKIKIRIKKWYLKNKGLINAGRAKRRAMLLRATPKWLTKEQLEEIKQIYIICKEIQWLSEEPLEVDHIIPLRGKTVCGFHHPDNLQIIPRSKNRKKSNKINE